MRTVKSVVLRRIPILRPRGLPDPSSPHETRANSILRPVVFGGNDGLVSNLALVMGVAGANPEPGIVVLAGISQLTRRNPLYSGLRQLLLVGVAAVVTYGVGALVGVRA